MQFARINWIVISLLLILFYSRQITHVICFGRHRDKEFKKGKKVYYLIYGFWITFLSVLCLIMGSAVGVDHTFDYGWNTIQVYCGNKNYFNGQSIYDEKDYKHQGDFTLEYFVSRNEDIETISKEIIEGNISLTLFYNLNDISITILAENQYAIYDKGEVIAAIDVKNAGVLKKISFHWNKEMLNQREKSEQEKGGYKL